MTTQGFAAAEKPQITLLPRAIAPYPAKNYIWNLLLQDLAASAPRRALDAACGRLRNYWMFTTGDYCGLDISWDEVVAGLCKPLNQKLLQKRTHRRELYIGDMDEVIPLLGEFDVCVSTGTLGYVRDADKVLVDLAKAVSLGGNLFVTHRPGVNGSMTIATRWARLLAAEFASVKIVYYGCAEAELVEPHLRGSVTDDETRNQLILQYSQIEARAANIPNTHYAFYLRALRKQTPARTRVEELRVEQLDHGIRRIITSP
jgi:SAM-dependent methyltransferase